MQKMEHNAKYITGKVPQPKRTEWYQTQKIEKTQHKDEYLTGARFLNRKQQRWYADREDGEENSTRTSISGARFHNGRQQRWYADREDGEEKSTRTNYLTGKVRNTDDNREEKGFKENRGDFCQRT